MQVRLEVLCSVMLVRISKMTRQNHTSTTLTKSQITHIRNRMSPLANKKNSKIAIGFAHG